MSILEQGRVFQDARDVQTKNSKTFPAYFCPVGGDSLEIVTDWCEHLRAQLLWSNDEPLFPKMRVGLGERGGFQAMGLAREHWNNTGPIRKIYKEGFEVAGLPYFNPHCFRDVLVQLGERICTKPEEFKARLQNIGHERVLTTLTSYGAVPGERQAESIRGLGQETGCDNAALLAELAEVMRKHGDDA